MDKEKIELIESKFGNALSNEQLTELKDKLAVSDDDKYESADAVKVKSTSLTVILSSILGLFGAGSFYLGHYKLGIIKIALNIVLPLTLGLVFLFYLSPLHKNYATQAQNISVSVAVNLSEPFNEYKDAINENFEEIKDNANDTLKCKELTEEILILRDKFTKEFDIRIKAFNEYVTPYTDTAVKKRLDLDERLSDLSETVDKIKTETDLNRLENQVKAISDIIYQLQTKSDNAFSDWRFSYNFQNMYIGTAIIVGGIIIAAYWIGEIFRERSECQKLNFDKLTKAIN